MDTDEERPGDRMRAYIGGERIELVLDDTSDPLPEPGDVIDLGAGLQRMFLGRAFSAGFVAAPGDVRTANSRIYYAAAYLEALDDPTIVVRARLLAALDDP